MTTHADYEKLKVTELKDLLKEAGLPQSGKKVDLIQRLTEHAQRGQALETTQVAPIEQEPEAIPVPVDELVLPHNPTVASTEIIAETTAPVTNSPAKVAHERDEAEDTTEPAAKRARVDDDVAMAEAGAEPVPAPPPTEAPPPPPAEPAPAPPVPTEPSIVPEAAPEPTAPPAEGEIAEEEEEPPVYEFEPEEQSGQPTDLYLDTINRSVLDFDFERLCSVTLSHNNIYACLVDGKYFQGRGKSSPAYAHAIAEDKHVYINLSTQKVYILPDGYEVNDPSLDDIKYLLHPTFTPSLLKKIDSSITPAFDLHQQPYYPGFVGLNNIKANSYMNAILQSLVHVTPLRDYFILDPKPNEPGATELVKRFGMLCRKVWNPRAFKGQVSPHELLQECSNRSGGRFKITQVGDPLEFLGWLLNTLHHDLGGNKKPRSSIIHAAFQGEVRIDDQQVITSGEYGGVPKFDLDREIKTTKSPFLFLAIDLPPRPVFQGVIEKDIIPQVPIDQVLAKYDGVTTQEAKGIIRRFKITRLPPFLILHIKRFTKNNFVEEKNPTIVNYPLRGVDMQDYVETEGEKVAQYYDLVSNITHDSNAGTAREETSWKTHVHLRPPRDERGRLEGDLTEDDERWFQLEDLNVQEIEKALVPLGPAYIQIWRRRSLKDGEQLRVEVPKQKVKGLAVPAPK